MTENLDIGRMSLQEKKTLLAKKLSEKKKKGNEVTDSQKSLWYIYKSSPTSNAYNQYFASVLKGNLNKRAFLSAFEKTIIKHAELRARFEEKDGVLYKYIDDDIDGFVTEINCEDYSEEAVKTKVNELVKIPFVLEGGKLFRVYLLIRKEPVLVIVSHHIVVDLWSMGIIIKDMNEFYTCIRNHKEIVDKRFVTYTDYTIWKSMLLNSDEGKRQENYWIKKLNGYTQVIDIAKKRRDTFSGNLGGIYNSFLSKNISEELKRICREENTTLYVVLLSLYNILLHKYTGVDDITIGSSVAGRNNPKYENVVGYFVNLLPIRNTICSSNSFAEYVSEVKKTVLESLTNQEYPFSKILDNIDVPVQSGFSPLIQVAFSMENMSNSSLEKNDSALFSMGSGKTAKIKFADLVLESIDVEAQDTPYDLLLKAETGKEEINLSWQYNASIVDEQDIEDMARHFENLVRAVASNKEILIKDIDILDEKDYKLLFDDYNPKIEEFDGRNFIQEFNHICDNYPNNKAVTMGEISISYKELDRKSSQIACFLTKSGIEKGNFVGVCLEKSIKTIELILGILKSGCVYTPIDPDYPNDRIEYIINDSKMNYIITSKTINVPVEVTAIYISDFIEQSEKADPVEFEKIKIEPNDAAYLIYTSGSTGKPKGVLIEHIGICNMVDGLNKELRVNSESRVLQFASLSFDASIAEIFTTLMSGAELVMAKKEELYPGMGLEILLKEHEITEVILTPSVLKLTNPEGFTSLKTVMSAGESCSLSIIQKWSKYVRFINAYGPTESTVCATLTVCDYTDSTVHIGKAINNTRIYILNKDGYPVPPGMKGELCISSIGLARCYINNEEMTSAKFIENKIDNDAYERIYKTGDYANFLKDGNINFIGRVDNQVKIRGFRIELEEIEHCINMCYFVRESAVILKEENDGLKRLVAFVSINDIDDAKTTGILDNTRDFERTLKDHIKRNLTSYMMPSIFVFMNKLPHNISEKIDKNKLKEIELTNQQEYQNDQMLTEIQRDVRKMWAEVLFNDAIEMEDNFLELGGHSLLLVQLIGKIRDKYNINISVEDIYKSLVLKEMCNLIESKIQMGGNKISTIIPCNRKTNIPITYAQKRLLFLEELGIGGSAYNISGSIRIKGDLDIEALKRAFNILVNRYDILKTTFKKSNDTYLQEVRESVETIIKVYTNETKFTDKQLENLINKLNKEEFDLKSDLLIRANLIFTGEQEYILNFSIHHSIGDGLSVMLITKEWSEIYKQIVTGEKIEICQNEYQYSDFAIWQQENITGETLDNMAKYWLNNLNGTENKYLQIETDYERPSNQKYTGASIRYQISEDIYTAIKSISRKTNSTVYMVLLAAFNVLLYKHTGELDINVGTPISGRNHRQTQDMIGMFINTVIIRTILDENEDFGQLLAVVKKTVTDAMNHQDMPFEKLVEFMNPDRNTNRSPLFQVMFNMLTLNDSKFDLYGLDVEEIENKSIDSKYDFTLYVTEDKDQIDLILSYNTSLFTYEHMSALLEQYSLILSQLRTDIIINEISLADPKENQRIYLKNGCQSESNQSLMSMFSKCVAELPEKEAVNSYDLAMSYHELNTLSNMLAKRLHDKGLGKGKCIGIYADRSGTIPVAILAALKLYSDFVIIDSNYTTERIISYLNELHVDAMILCNMDLDRRILRELDKNGTISFIYDYKELLYDKQSMPEIFEYCYNPEYEDDTYYYTFTSGTTNKPNLIKSSIRSVSHFIQWYIKEFSFNNNNRFSMLSGLAHDPLIRDIFTPLCCGASLHIPKQEDLIIQDNLERWINENNIEIVHQTPSFVKMLEGKKLSTIKQISLGGEILTNSVLKILENTIPQAKIVNCYGASETPQIMAYHVVDIYRDTSINKIPIGKGIDGVEIYIIDKNMKESGLYQPGEIWIRSGYISEGYVNSKELTNKKFITNPFTGEESDVIYKTGDNGYRLSNGDIVCIGRSDSQVKIRGFRVEISEIEQKISSFDEVKDVRVTINNDSLIAYLVLHDGSMISQRDISERLRVIFPGYMIPSKYVFIDKIIINQNGKTDFKKLEKLHTNNDNKFENSESIVRDTEAENIVLSIWKEILGREDITVHDNFFDVGGHSLILAKLYEKLKNKLLVDFEMLDLFKYSNINAFLENVIYKDKKSSTSKIKKPEKGQKFTSGDIAVIGMSGRFPMAENIEEYWSILVNGKEAITYLTDEELLAEGIPEETINDPKYVKAAMLLKDYDKFDANFFDMTPRDSEIMDPQQKIFMEECYHALENAGCNSDNYEGKIGVFGGSSMNSYMIHNLIHNKDFILGNQALTHSFIHGNINDYLCTRVSYKLNLTGPAVTVQTACSTSMTAVHLACQSLLNYESDIALAGGVTVKIPQKEGYYYIDGGIFSRDGHCRPFDNDCTGTIFGSGVGVVVLKRLEDAVRDGDEISAVIKGTGINNDGNMKVGFTATSISGQADAIKQAIENSGIDVESIGFIEAHGTGTRMGDPIEIKALDNVYKEYTDKNSFCAINSVKANIGHLNAASGIASLIAAILAVKIGEIPPSINCDNLNKEIDFNKTPFYINQNLKEWEADKRVAGVSSFGMGGTNVHVILQNYCEKNGEKNE